jgi:hypothetical protein
MYTCAFLPLLAALSLVGCDSDDVIRHIPGSGPAIRTQAVIEVESSHPVDHHTVDFGEVYAGEQRVQELIVRNLGDDTLQIQDLILSDVAAFSITNQGEYAMLLAPDVSTVLQIAYTPLQDEHTEGTLIVASNDRETPEVAVRLLAEGLAPAVALQPPAFDFGNLELGCVQELPVTISNTGRAPLDVFGLDYLDLADNDELFLEADLPDDGDPDTVDFRLDPGASVHVVIHYTPADVEPDSGVLHVLTNTPGEPADGATAQQFGIAHLGATVVDEFMQLGNNATDILFVVDASGSMGEEQSSLAVNFASFLQIIEALDVDYHLAVTSTDVSQCAQFAGSVPIITPSTPDPASTFSANVNLGVGQSGIEQGLHCAYLALQDAVNGVGVNGGFLRDDAGLRIIFVSDEQEQSGSIMSWSTIDYVDWFQSLKANPEHVVLSDITGGMAGCSGTGGSASTGSEYVLATQMTGGISASICDSNWVSTLSALGWLSQSFADTFELSQVPVADTIETRLNHVPIFVGWLFDAALNAIVFDLDHVPENGDVIEVQYSVQGDCEG